MFSTVPLYAAASVLSLPPIVTGPSVLTWVACALYNDFEESTNILKLLSNPRSNHRLIKYSRGIQPWDIRSLPCFLYPFFNEIYSSWCVYNKLFSPLSLASRFLIDRDVSTECRYFWPFLDDAGVNLTLGRKRKFIPPTWYKWEGFMDPPPPPSPFILPSFLYVAEFWNEFAFSGKPSYLLMTSPTMVAILDFAKNQKSG